MMTYTKHASEQMALRGIIPADVDAVLANPTKSASGDGGARNFWGYGTSGYRIRVTVVDDHIKTVAWADYRKRKGAP